MTLIDSSWIWTEPHSMRLKLRLTIRADVGESPRTTTVQQRTPVELHVRWKQCPDCNREYTNRTWQALVQLRQKHPDNGSKKGLLMMEAVIRQNEDIRKHIISMETSRHGFDFYFLELMHARAFSSFLASCLPMKIKTSQKLVSEDLRNNSANVKSTTICEMVPLCRDDLIICDKAAGSGCNIKLSGRMCIVNKVSSTLQLVDAAPARTNIQDMFAILHQEKYWKGESHYRIVFSGRRMVKFVVMDVDLCDPVSSSAASDQVGDHDVSKYALADVSVVRESEFGQTDEILQCTTHLGNLLEIGDTVLGYDLVNSVLPAAAEWSIDHALHSSFQLPDVVLVKKIHSAGARGGDFSNEAQQDTSDKPKAKNSGSKRREKRKQKQEKKMKELAEAADRMGLSGGGGEEDAWDQERKEFEEELKNDMELAAEFRSLVEKEIDMAKEAMEKLTREQMNGTADEN